MAIEGFTESWLTGNEYNEDERKAFPLVLRGLSARVGKDRAITNDDMRDALLKKYNLKIGDARLRKMINLIRNKMIIPGLIASSNGYYVTDDPKEVERWLKGITGRITALESLYDRGIDFLHTLKK